MTRPEVPAVDEQRTAEQERADAVAFVSWLAARGQIDSHELISGLQNGAHVGAAAWLMGGVTKG